MNIPKLGNLSLLIAFSLLLLVLLLPFLIRRCYNRKRLRHQLVRLMHGVLQSWHTSSVTRIEPVKYFHSKLVGWVVLGLSALVLLKLVVSWSPISDLLLDRFGRVVILMYSSTVFGLVSWGHLIPARGLLVWQALMEALAESVIFYMNRHVYRQVGLEVGF